MLCNDIGFDELIYAVEYLSSQIIIIFIFLDKNSILKTFEKKMENKNANSIYLKSNFY